MFRESLVRPKRTKTMSLIIVPDRNVIFSDFYEMYEFCMIVAVPIGQSEKSTKIKFVCVENVKSLRCMPMKCQNGSNAW